MEGFLMIGSKFKHLKTGGYYEILGTGLLESSKEPMVIYRSLQDGTVWIRSEKEFFDGRFQEDSAQ